VGLLGAYFNESGIVNLVGLWSAPGHRDVGVASALLAAVEAWARTIGADRLRMWVVERNEFAMAFWGNEGFAATGAAIPYELDPRLRQVAMVKAL
jgi:GNAT superfamily N-acetyltransferase